ncbi:MAG: hypothetical protein GKS07_09175 [Nitrosopumilus sp.]|nr:MAG: hypothetical protein GKS07_09175 [Nitrosopumilus sp.]
MLGIYEDNKIIGEFVLLKLLENYIRISSIKIEEFVMNNYNNRNAMTTKKQLIMFGVIAIAVASLGIGATQIEAEERTKPTARSGLGDPFSFNYPESEAQLSKYSDATGATPWAELSKTDSQSYPILITASGDQSSTIKFHATYGNQMDDIKMPHGMTAKVVPETISLKAGESQIINLEVRTNGNAVDALYLMNIVGVYGDEPNDFKGTMIKLKAGEGDNKFASAYGAQ